MSLDNNKIETNEFENDDNEETVEELVNRLCETGNAMNAMFKAQKEEQVIYVEKIVENTAIPPITKENNLDRSKTTDYLKVCGAVEKQKEIGYGIKDMLVSMAENLKTKPLIDFKNDKPTYDAYKFSSGCMWFILRIGAFAMLGFCLFLLIASIVKNGIIATLEDKWLGDVMFSIFVSAPIAFSKIIV